MKLNFKRYINIQLNENTYKLKDLLNNFEKVFPYSDKDLGILSYKIEGKDTDKLTCTGIIQSEFKEFSKYNVTVIFYRENTDLPFSISNIGKVFCECRAFRYNIAYPNVQNNVFAGTPQTYNRIPNKIRNPEKITSVCKHLYSFLIYLYNKGIIKNN